MARGWSFIAISVLLAAVLRAAPRNASAQGMSGMDQGMRDHDMASMDSHDAEPHGMDPGDMDPHEMSMMAHMKMTELWPANEQDRGRADQIVRELRGVLEKYKDYHVAEQDGYKPILPDFKLPLYHFTNYWYGFEAAFHFAPDKPTSILYKKTPGGYELLGAMYTATRRASMEELNERAPLSVARWHSHINICIPRASQIENADWKKFGFAGSIATQAACKEAGGKFYPQVYGWMLHVYPFESSPDKIWAH